MRVFGRRRCAGADEVTSLTQTLHELSGKGSEGLSLCATPLFGALAIERQLVRSCRDLFPLPIVIMTRVPPVTANVSAQGAASHE